MEHPAAAARSRFSRPLQGCELGFPNSRAELESLKKSDSRKVLCAALLKRRTSVSNEWIAERLAMGHPASMSQHVNLMRRDPKSAGNLKKHEQALKSKDCPA